MRITQKMILISISCGLVASLLISIAMLLIILPQVRHNENEIAIKSFSNADAIIQQQVNRLDNTALDWAVWDDTYDFVSNSNSAYIECNLQSGTLSALDVNFMIYTNLEGALIYEKTYQIDSANEQSFIINLMKNIDLEQHQDAFLDNKIPAGIIVIDGEPILLAICPITTSDCTATPNGYFVIGRYMTESDYKYIETITEIDINEISSFPISMEDVVNEEFMEYTAPDEWTERTFWIKEHPKTLVVVSQLKGLYGQRNIPFYIIKDRSLYNNMLNNLHIYIIGCIAFIMITVVVSLYITNKMIIRRVHKLQHFINTVIANKDTKARLNMTGKDEITQLTNQINSMLSDLDGAITALRESEARQRLVMDATTDGYFDFDISKRLGYVSLKWIERLGLVLKDDLLNTNTYTNYIYPEDRKKTIEHFNDFILRNDETYYDEYRVMDSDGQLVWIAIRGKSIEQNAQGNPTRLVGTITDISVIKQIEAEKKLLRESDTITGLKNRYYFEPIAFEANSCKSCSFGIIFLDINGLKLINDSFGKEIGDKLLKIIGCILKNSCGAEEIPIRWGGDEFIVFSRNNTPEKIDETIKNIKTKCAEIKEFASTVSISAGWAIRDITHPTVESVLKHAEERLNRNKLLENQSQRSAVIRSLTQTLHEKHIETEEHIQRTKNLCRLIGKKLNLRQDELDELELLGTLHDIGKIGIPESILLKPGKLDAAEWEVMIKHCEIGYRIAVSTPDLAHVADEILYHHERYDGTGYPQGLKGENIPKLSRLLSIVDAYDVMVHDRVYKKAMSKTEAIQELTRCTETQFDPFMISVFIQLLRDDESL